MTKVKVSKATSTEHYNRLPHPEPIRTYKAVIHGQEVEIKVYPSESKILNGVKEGYRV